MRFVKSDAYFIVDNVRLIMILALQFISPVRDFFESRKRVCYSATRQSE